MPGQDQCVFCRIVNGGEASIVDEDEHTLAFMNLRQANPGHVLVIPKRHVEQIYDLDDRTAGHLGRAVVKVSRAVRSAMQVTDLNVWQSNGAMAGQEIRPFPPVQPRSHLDAIAERIRLHMHIGRS